MDTRHDGPSVAFALGGLAGNNAHGAGFLAAAYRHVLTPCMISFTSGQILWVDRYLTNPGALRDMLQRDIEDLTTFHNVNLDFARLALFGKSGVYRPAYVEYTQDLLANTLKALAATVSHAGNVFLLDQLLRVFPARLLVPQFDEQTFFRPISERFNAAPVGLAFNSYDPVQGLEQVYLNDRARALLSPHGRSYQPGAPSRHRKHTVYQAITPEAVREALWIYEYGFDRGNEFVDGAYYRQVMLSELTYAERVYVARPVSRRWLGETPGPRDDVPGEPPGPAAELPRTYIGVQDLKTKVTFNGSYAGERAQIELINKLVGDAPALRAKYHPIELVEVEISRPRDFFDYIFESLEVFDDAVRGLEAKLGAIPQGEGQSAGAAGVRSASPDRDPSPL